MKRVLSKVKKKAMVKSSQRISEMKELIRVLSEFANSPSKDGARVCRDQIAKLQNTVELLDFDKLFINRVAPTVARPYQSARAELHVLIAEYRLKQFQQDKPMIVDWRRIRRIKALTNAIDYESEGHFPAGDIIELIFLGKLYREIIEALLEGGITDDYKNRVRHLIEIDKIKPTVDDI